jgi:uncharacterized protein YlxP (DUF503 family)
MAAHALVLTVEVHVPASRSLKAKRAVIRAMVDGARARFGVASAETDHQDTWQRAELAFASVSGSSGHAADVIDGVERYLWSFGEAEVVRTERHWVEVDR